jgi:hypothetical protein
MIPPVYLNGVRVPEETSRALMNSMGPLHGICDYCGGSVVEIKSVIIGAKPTPVFRIWCSTCGRYGDVVHEFPPDWYKRILRALELQVQRIF